MAAATALLEEAGYTKGADGIYAKGGKKLSLRISTTAGNQLRETQGELFQAQMKEIGVDIKIANADSTEVLRRVAARRATSTSPTSPGSAARSRSRAARTSTSPAAAATTASTRTRRSTTCSPRPGAEIDEAKAAELGNQIDQQLTADMATIPLYQKPTFIAWRNTFANIGDNSTQDGPVLERQPVGAEGRLESRRAGNALDAGRWETAGPRRLIVTLVTSPGEGAPCSASSSAGC